MLQIQLYRHEPRLVTVLRYSPCTTFTASCCFRACAWALLSFWETVLTPTTSFTLRPYQFRISNTSLYSDWSFLKCAFLWYLNTPLIIGSWLRCQYVTFDTIVPSHSRIKLLRPLPCSIHYSLSTEAAASWALHYRSMALVLRPRAFISLLILI